MANTLTAYYATLVAAVSEASQVLVGTTSFLDAVYKNVKSTEYGAMYQTINVGIPAAPTVSDQGVAAPTFVDQSVTNKAITINKHPASAMVFRDFEQVNSALALREAFLDGAIKGIAESINSTVAALFTTGNFATNTAISCTSHIVTTAQFLQGWGNLETQKVPMHDLGNLYMINHGVVQAAIMGDASWTDAQKAGTATAERVRALGDIKVAYGFDVRDDQATPVSGTPSSRTFTSAAFHKYAVALVSRPLPPGDPNTVLATYTDWKGVPIRVSVGYSITQGGWVLNAEAAYGVAVIRPEMCQIFTISE